MFLLKILQSQHKNANCWFFQEKLSEQQEFLRVFLEKARQNRMVRKFLISNRKNWVTVQTSDVASEKPLYIVEPRSQLLDHCLTTQNEPSYMRRDWAQMLSVNASKHRKNHIRLYG